MSSNINRLQSGWFDLLFLSACSRWLQCEAEKVEGLKAKAKNDRGFSLTVFFAVSFAGAAAGFQNRRN